MAAQEGRAIRSGARRYPALAYLAAAGLLSLLLPSGLNVLQAGPATLAEYAPVPGESEGSDAPVADLGATSSDGLGALGGAGGSSRRAEGAAGDVDRPVPSGGRLVRRPGTKRCVGDPPRQTEDALSPPCIAFFDGDNGGATAKGVTRDEVTVVAWFVSLSNDRREGEVVDCAAEVTSEDTTQDHLCKAYMKYFNERYQTYNRNVHLYLAHGDDVEIADLDARYEPFAFVSPSATRQVHPLGILSAGYTSGTRKEHAQFAPNLIAFRPDLDDMAEMAATMVCLKLAGRPARYAGDPALQTKERVFAYWRSSSMTTLDKLMLERLEPLCGVKVEQRSNDPRDQTVAARFKAAGVTTVLVFGADLVPALANQATRAGWFPEWVVPGSTNLLEININFYSRLVDPLQWSNAFALTVDYRRGRAEEQPWFRAFKEGCPDCPEPSLAGGGGSGAAVATSAYDSLTMLFYGIQAAGPRLTIENIDRGMHAIPPAASDDPFKPAAYFAPGNYTFVKDAMLMWWDPTGEAPGAAERGCWRLAHEGRRFRAGEWIAGDGDLRAAGPCQGDVFRG